MKANELKEEGYYWIMDDNPGVVRFYRGRILWCGDEVGSGLDAYTDEEFVGPLTPPNK